jgi:hypothetical protein
MQTNNQNMRRWTDSNGDYVVQGDPFNLAANGELGPSSNLNFGRPIASARNDPAFAMGFGLRPYEWEFSAGVQHELIPRVSINGVFFRRIYGNFQVTDNQAVTPGDYGPSCVSTPTDSRLPGGGGGGFENQVARLGTEKNTNGRGVNRAGWITSC